MLLSASSYPPRQLWHSDAHWILAQNVQTAWHFQVIWLSWRFPAGIKIEIAAALSKATTDLLESDYFTRGKWARVRVRESDWLRCWHPPLI